MTETNERLKQVSILPGGSLHARPYEIGGIKYDPAHRLQTTRKPDGSTQVIAGYNKDIDYSNKFWNKEQPKGLREAMIENLRAAMNAGFFSSFADLDEEGELDEQIKEKLSAYRVLADELGYEVGPFKFNKKAGTVQATMLPKNK